MATGWTEQRSQPRTLEPGLGDGSSPAFMLGAAVRNRSPIPVWAQAAVLPSEAAASGFL